MGEIKSKTLKLWRRWRWGRGLTKRVGRDPPLWNRSQQGFGIRFWYGSNDGLKSNESCSTPLFHISADQVEGGPSILSAFPLQPLTSLEKPGDAAALHLYVQCSEYKG